MEECAEIIQAAWREAAGEATAGLGARFFEDSEERQDEAAEIQAAWQAPPPRRRRRARRVVAKVDGDLVDALSSIARGDSAHQAYAAVALQRLTLGTSLHASPKQEADRARPSWRRRGKRR